MKKNRVSGSVTRNVASRALICLFLVSSAACAESPSKEDDLQLFATLEKADKSIRNVDTVKRPTMLVTFAPVGVNNALCPTEVDFGITVGGNTIVLPTGVPVRPTPGNDIRWVAVKEDLTVLPKQTTDFFFGVTFNPFSRMNNDTLVSEYRTFPNISAYIAGPVDFRAAGRLPVGVNYKYTVVRLNRIGTDWVVDDDCRPLDPIIRLI